MVGALLVLLLVVVAFVLFRGINRDAPPSPVRTVDYQRVVDFAREQTDLDLLAPPRLPAGWRATTVDFVDTEGDRWHLGLLTDEERYVGLEQSTSSAASMVETHVDEDAARGEPVEVAGRPWRSWTDADGDLALVREDGGTTTLVVGHVVPQPVLVDFAASLR